MGTIQGMFPCCDHCGCADTERDGHDFPCYLCQAPKK